MIGAAAMAVYGVSRATRDLLKLYAGGPHDTWDVEQLLSGGERSMLVTAVAAALPMLPEDSRRVWARIVGSG